MDDAIAGLAVAGITGTLGLAVRFRARWFGRLAGVVGGLGLWCLLTYYFGGSIWLPSFGFVVAPAPAWIPFLIGLLLGAGIAASAAVLVSKGRPPSAVPHALALVPEEERMWAGLEEAEQALMKQLWASPRSFLADLELNPLKARFGVERWNAVTHTLSAEKQLIRQDLGTLTTLQGPRRQVGWALTPKGKNVMTWLTKQASGGRTPAEARQASRGAILNGAAKLAWTPAEYQSMWSTLTEDDRLGLALMWGLPDTYFVPGEIGGARSQGKWNAVEHRLIKAGLIARIGDGWQLTPEGKEIAEWATTKGLLEPYLPGSDAKVAT